ncbi:MAG: dinuclear metal center YbgI/SA1388 family protein, partial [Flavobacteriales bacterium]
MQAKEIIRVLEEWAPPSLQESYDNSGLIVGNPNTEVTGILVNLDCIEEVVDEAISTGCNMIVAHHPIVFQGLKRFNGKNYVERTVIKAIKNDILIYAIHTNLDHVKDGVNKMIGEKLGLKNLKILAPKSGMLCKLVTYVPTDHAKQVRQAIFNAGAGHIGEYDQCSFNLTGQGTFRGSENSKPFAGEAGKPHTEDEIRIETIMPTYVKSQVLKALLSAHPYEEVPFDVYSLENSWNEVGSGMIGELNEPVSTSGFLGHVKTAMKVPALRFTESQHKTIQKVAFCGGSGSFLINAAK